MTRAEAGIEEQLEMRMDALYQTVQRFRLTPESGIIRRKIYEIFPGLEKQSDDTHLAVDFGLLYGSVTGELGLTRFESLHIADAAVFKLQHNRNIDLITKRAEKRRINAHDEHAKHIYRYGDLIKVSEIEDERYSMLIEQEMGVPAPVALSWLRHMRSRSQARSTVISGWTPAF